MVSNKANENNKRGFNQMAHRQRFKQVVGKQYNQVNDNRNMSDMFNANQLGDNPGFLDFNDDSIASTLNEVGNSASGPSTGNVSNVGNKNTNSGRKLNINMRRPMKNVAPGMRHRMNGLQGWCPPMAPPNMFSGPPPPGRRGPMNPPPIPPHPAQYRNAHGGGMRMRGHQNGRFGPGPQGPMSLLSMNRQPIPAPIPPMSGRPMNPPHNVGRMMPPPLRHCPDGSGRRNTNGNVHGRHAFSRNGMPVNGTAMNVNGKRPRPNNMQNREEYPLDKPWVTEEIKAEHEMKTNLANRLKGHRDDALFAQFKEQRDKFVKMYEAARIEFDKKADVQDVEKILTESTPCKKVCENVEKSNDNAVSAENPNEVNSSSGQAFVPIGPFNESTGTSECATDAGTTTSAVTPTASIAVTSTTTTPSIASAIETTANASPSSAKAESISAETLPMAAENTIVATEAIETEAPTTVL